MQILKEYVIWVLARFRSSLIIRFLGKLASSLTKGRANFSFNMNLNGERMVLRSLPEATCVFDVGANRGDWTAVALAEHPTAKIHCFEIASKTFKQLADRYASNPSVHCNDFGLSNREGTIPLNMAEGHDAHTTALQPTTSGVFVKSEGRIRCGDAYVKEKGIDTINFLKIDVEGMEHLVLKGLTETLRAGKVEVIQFEYGEYNKESHFLLMDFYQFLEPLGYLIGKIYPDCVDFRLYDRSMDDFIGPNYLAVRKDRVPLLNRLSRNV